MLANVFMDQVIFPFEYTLARYLGIAVLLAAILVTPLCIWAMRPNASKRRRLIALGAGYLITMAVLGVYAYAVLPVQYTQGLDLSWPPSSSNSLAGMHFELERRLSSPGEISTPAYATELREAIDFERRMFLLRWIALTLTLTIPVVLLRRWQPFF